MDAENAKNKSGKGKGQGRKGDHVKLQNVKKGVVRLDRRSGKGVTGSPKKGGLGGKFTWSGPSYTVYS